MQKGPDPTGASSGCGSSTLDVEVLVIFNEQFEKLILAIHLKGIVLRD
jgi:hypothetical protein